MIQTIKKFVFAAKLFRPFSLIPQFLVRTHLTEQFDVVERVPIYARIKSWYFFIEDSPRRIYVDFLFSERTPLREQPAP